MEEMRALRACAFAGGCAAGGCDALRLFPLPDEYRGIFARKILLGLSPPLIFTDAPADLRYILL